jgi:hypothetical protein
MRDANIEDPNGKNIKEGQLSASTYKIIEPRPEELNDRIAAAGLFVYSDVNAEAKVQMPASEPPTSQPPSHKPLTERKQRFAKNPIRLYAMMGVGLGILIGVIYAAISLFMGNPVGRYDLGPVIADGTGLKGHLYINWEKTLHYRLTLETIYPEQQEGFALEVANPPYPLFIEIHLQDDEGLILCSRGIVLKYDALSTATTANHPNEPPSAVDIAQLNAQEQEREQGKDIFQNQIASGGQVVALNAQGVIPCSAKSYEKTTQWNFSTNFPSLAEQDEGLELRHEMRGNAGQRSAAHNKAVKAAEKLLPFSIEGDDMIVEFDVNRGVIVTNGRNTFFFDKTSKGSADPVWQEYPVSIHFRCDRNSDCTLMHAGAGALRVRLKR